MSDQTQINGFANGMADLRKDWAALTADQRSRRLQDLVDARAAASGFPSPQVAADSLGGPNGVLRFPTWQVVVDKKLVNSPALSDSQAAALGDTLYHETRHAEQWYQIARRQAAEGIAPAEIARRTQMPVAVTKQAATQPIAANDPGRACADAMYESVYGSGRGHRNTTLTNLGAQGKAVEQAQTDYNAAVADNNAKAAAYKTLQQRPTPTTAAEAAALSRDRANAHKAWTKAYADVQSKSQTLSAARATYTKTYADYRALPEERDAWDAGGRAGAAVTAELARRNTVPPPTP